MLCMQSARFDAEPEKNLCFYGKWQKQNYSTILIDLRISPESWSISILRGGEYLSKS